MSESLQSSSSSDHHVLGRELQVYTTSDLVGPGLPIWLPDGAVIRRELEDFIVERERLAGFHHVYSPPLAKKELYEISGHWEHYQDSMFPPMRVHDADVVLRPMNCPHHVLVFKHQARSWRDLPLRIAELGQMFRNELSGAVGGLSRVRCMTLNDAHLFVTPDQVASEVSAVLDMIESTYKLLGLPDVSYRLSCRGSGDKYVADDSLWVNAEAALEDVLLSRGASFVKAADEAAFYGPKIDVQVASSSSRVETVSTVQLDFHLPERFGLEFVAPDGSRQRPVMIHRSVVSTMERMTAFLLEVHQGNLPFWLSPHQVAVLPVSEFHESFASQLVDDLFVRGVRAAKFSEGPLGSRVSDARSRRTAFILVVGDRELASNSVSVRPRGHRSPVTVPADLLPEQLSQLHQSRSLSFVHPSWGLET